eukprot:TRINITY_DN7829_c0_g1_i1.p1 TRINITY_DN7829_c0_g1~~TRINITY_DN7829_c0_g1_i1.p1  ORF type:complete len:260 (+),score=48.74 TRINITY_DN7829_c0_g1_i1:61-840(+)
MARVASSNPVGLHKLIPCIKTPHLTPYLRISSPLSIKPHGFQRLFCRINPDSADSPTKEEPLVESGLVKDNISQATSDTQNAESAEFPNKNINRQIAVASTVAAIGLFLSARLEFGVSLRDLSAAAIPYEQALSNGRPTVVEFYADWCEVCRELAPDIYKVEQQYKDRVNFVMLNVDNTKWEQELDEFGVEGIPHFSFLDREGNEEGNVVGRLPKRYLLENVAALAKGEASIPHSRIVGQYSSAESRKVNRVVDPRSHG